MHKYNLAPIGFVSSCYKEKFGIPRQPNLVKNARAELILNQEFSEESVRGLDGFSHIWISFIFHKTYEQGWKPMVRPPRLGGDSKVGVFASRSTFRPNPLGLSVVELKSIEYKKQRIIINVAGADLLDGTPIVDIKPYLSYADAIPEARSGFAQNSPEIKCSVEFSKKASLDSQIASERIGQNIEVLVRDILQFDPRPSYQQGAHTERVYSMKLHDFDLKWTYIDDNKIKVLALLS